MEIYVDGSKSVKEELKISIVGYNSGNEILRYCDRIPFIGDSMLSEQVALIIAMKFIEKFYSTEDVLVYSDQLFYVDLLNNNNLSTKALHKHEFVGYMLNLYNHLPKLKIKHIKSSKNKADKVMNKKIRCDYYLNTENTFRGLVDDFRMCANDYSYMLDNKGEDDMQAILKEIYDIIKGEPYSMRIYGDNTIVFYLYEIEIPIVVNLNTKKVYLDFEDVNGGQLNSEALSELLMITKLLEDNIQCFTDTFQLKYEHEK